MGRRFKSIETVHAEERDTFFRGLTSLANLDRRAFFRLAGLSAGIAASKGLLAPHSFQLIDVAGASVGGDAAEPGPPPRFTFAYISDTHLYEQKLNDRFVRSILRAIDDINRLSPQPDFVLFGGDLAQLGKKEELKLGAELMKSIKAPLRWMVGEHDWYLDMGETWRELFGEPQYSFDHKGVHFVTLIGQREGLLDRPQDDPYETDADRGRPG